MQVRGEVVSTPQTYVCIQLSGCTLVQVEGGGDTQIYSHNWHTASATTVPAGKLNT